MKTAFVFPGQGSQKVGMLQDLYNAYPIVKQRFEEADEAGRRVRCRPPTTVGERAPSAGGRWHLARGHQRRAA